MMNKPNTDKDKSSKKKESMEGAGVADPGTGKRKRVMTTPSKKEMAAELDKYKAAESAVKMSADNFQLITKGLLITVEGLSKLPFSQVNPELKKGFDESLALCFNTYLPGTTAAKYAPVFQLGTFGLLIVQDALEKKREQRRIKPGEHKPAAVVSPDEPGAGNGNHDTGSGPKKSIY